MNTIMTIDIKPLLIKEEILRQSGFCPRKINDAQSLADTIKLIQSLRIKKKYTRIVNDLMETIETHKNNQCLREAIRNVLVDYGVI